MVAPTFILTRTFAISALFVGAFPVTHAAPVPTQAATASSFLDRRFCRSMGCLYALPEADSSDATGNATALPPSAETTSALQVIDLLISALQSAATSLRQSSTAQTAISSVDDAAPVAVDAAAPVEADSLAAVIASLAKTGAEAPASSAPENEAPSSDAQEDAPTPAVEVIGFSTVKNTDVDTTAPM